MFTPDVPWRKQTGHMLWVGVWAVITCLGAFVLQADASGHGTHRQLGLPPCPAVLMFDRPCFGCGMTTSWTALLHGDFAASWAAHPLGAVTYLVYTLSVVFVLAGVARGSRFDSTGRAANRFLAAFAVVFVAVGATRFATVRYHDDPLQYARFNR